MRRRPVKFTARREAKEFDEKVIQVNRVSRKNKGGNRISFSVLTAVGDRQGRVGVGLGKAPDVASAIRKGFRRAKKNLIKVPTRKATIPHQVRIKQGAARLMLKPAPEGAGIKAGGSVRVVLELAGIKDVVAKILGTTNKASNVYAAIAALKKLKPVSGSRRESPKRKSQGRKSVTKRSKK